MHKNPRCDELSALVQNKKSKVRRHECFGENGTFEVMIKMKKEKGKCNEKGNE